MNPKRISFNSGQTLLQTVVAMGVMSFVAALMMDYTFRESANVQSQMERTAAVDGAGQLVDLILENTNACTYALQGQFITSPRIHLFTQNTKTQDPSARLPLYWQGQKLSPNWRITGLSFTQGVPDGIMLDTTPVNAYGRYQRNKAEISDHWPFKLTLETYVADGSYLTLNPTTLNWEHRDNGDTLLATFINTSQNIVLYDGAPGAKTTIYRPGPSGSGLMVHQIGIYYLPKNTSANSGVVKLEDALVPQPIQNTATTLNLQVTRTGIGTGIPQVNHATPVNLTVVAGAQILWCNALTQGNKTVNQIACEQVSGAYSAVNDSCDTTWNKDFMALYACGTLPTSVRNVVVDGKQTNTCFEMFSPCYRDWWIDKWNRYGADILTSNSIPLEILGEFMAYVSIFGLNVCPLAAGG